MDAAQRALDLSSVAGKANDLELMYIHSVAARRGLGSQTPNAGYVAGLRKIVAKYPNEVEAKTYLALAIMSGYNTPDKTPRAGSTEAVEILRGLLKDGAGSSRRSPLRDSRLGGINLCERGVAQLREVSAAGSRTFLMPSTCRATFTRRLDAGRDAEAAFAAAAVKERTFMDEDALYGTGHHGHNVHFEIVTLAFLGQYEKA